MNVNFPPVSYFVNQAVHSASQSMGTLGSRFVSLFQNRLVSTIILVVANGAFTLIGALIARVSIKLLDKYSRVYFINEHGKILEDSGFYRIRAIVGATSMVVTMTALNSAFTRLLQMPLSRIATITIATISGFVTLFVISKS